MIFFSLRRGSTFPLLCVVFNVIVTNKLKSPFLLIIQTNSFFCDLIQNENPVHT